MAKKILYICARYPHARGVKWTRSLARHGIIMRVLCGSSASVRYHIWTSKQVSEVKVAHRLDRKIPFSYLALRDVLAEARSFLPDCILVRDIFLAGYALFAARHLGIPCYIDMADNYPEVLLSVEKAIPARQLLKAILDKWESHVVHRASGIIFVSPESRIHVLTKHNAKCGTNHQNAFTVENVPDMQRPLVNHKRAFSGKLVYIGTYNGGIRDLDTVMHGLARYQELYHEDVSLTIYSFSFTRDAVDAVARRFPSLSDRIMIKPAVSNESLNQVLSDYDAGVIPHARVPGTEYTVPNKLFDYLFAGIRVVSSDNPPLKRVLHETGGGVLYHCGNSDDFAEAVRRLKEEIEEGRNEINVDTLKSKFTWENQIQLFVERILE